MSKLSKKPVLTPPPLNGLGKIEYCVDSQATQSVRCPLLLIDDVHVIEDGCDVTRRPFFYAAVMLCTSRPYCVTFEISPQPLDHRGIPQPSPVG